MLLPSTAQAGEELQYGPLPDWVVEVEPGIPVDDGDALPFRTLLYDFQVKFTPDGTSSFTHSIVEVLDPQGLAAGNLSIIWSPEHDQPTVHRVYIRRDDEVVDVLAEGQEFSILRREQNLEQAMLDGVLTATILPEGLQVGDIVEFATTIEGRNPVLGKHVEAMVGLNFPSEKSYVRLEWPGSIALNLSRSENLPELTVTKQGRTNVAELTLENVEPVLPPRMAPFRHSVFGLVEASDFRSWAELSQHFAPLYAKAAVIPRQGSLRDEVERIRSASNDPVLQAEAALRLVQEEVRYVALLMGQGGLTPADAGETWTRRFGDCKAKTALLLAILQELGIDAEAVFVSLGGGDMIRDRLPAVGLFNHVLVRARIGGQEYWLDGTRTGDRKLANLQVPDLGWGLPLSGKAADLVHMTPLPYRLPEEDLAIHFDASAGISLPAPARLEMVLRGDLAIGTNAALSAMSTSARDRSLRQYWRSRLSFVEIESTGMEYDADAAELRLTMTGEAEMDWDDGWYLTDWTGVGYSADFDRGPGPNADAPYLIPHPYFDRTRQTIILPPNFTEEAIRGQAEIDQVVSGVEYKRHASLDGNVFTIERTRRSLQSEFPASEARAAQRELRRLNQERVHLRRPDNYRRTMAEIDASLSRTPTTAQEYLARGFELLNTNRHEEALEDFEAALELEPDNALAWANHGVTLAWLRSYTKAEQSLDKAEKGFAQGQGTRADNAVVYRGRGLIAELEYDYAKAVKEYTTSLEYDPDNAFAFGHRAMANWQLRNTQSALADIDRALEISPGWIQLVSLRVDIHHSLGDEQKLLEQVDLLRGDDAMPEGTADFLIAGIYRTLGRYDDAIVLFDRMMDRGPVPAALASLATDEERQQMIDGAQVFMLGNKAQVQMLAGDFAGALQSYERSQQLDPAASDPALLTNKGIALWRLDRENEAQEAFEAARGLASGAMTLNNICYMKALAGLALERALEECEASLKQMPDFLPTLDSRALVYLQLGRLDEAIRDYDVVLKVQPEMAPALYGRAVAWARKGDMAKAKRDARAAFAASPWIEQTFEGSGIALPPGMADEVR